MQQCELNSASVLSFPATLRLACSRPICKTSRLSLDLLRYDFHWRPKSSCTTVALHERLREAAAHREHRWDCVEEATEKKKERLREATSHNQPTIPHRTDPHKEGKSLEDVEICPTSYLSHHRDQQEFTWTRKPKEMTRKSHGDGTELLTSGQPPRQVGRENGRTRRRCHHLLPLAPEVPREGCLANTDVAIRELDDVQKPSLRRRRVNSSCKRSTDRTLAPSGKVGTVTPKTRTTVTKPRTCNASPRLSGKPEEPQRAIKITAVLF